MRHDCDFLVAERQGDCMDDLALTLARLVRTKRTDEAFLVQPDDREMEPTAHVLGTRSLRPLRVLGAARAEDRGADPHMGRAKADRLFEIRAHPHTEEPEPVAPGDLTQQDEVPRRLLVYRRDAHQTLDRQAEAIAALDDEPVGIDRQDPG